MLQACLADLYKLCRCIHPQRWTILTFLYREPQCTGRFCACFTTFEHCLVLCSQLVSHSCTVSYASLASVGLWRSKPEVGHIQLVCGRLQALHTLSWVKELIFFQEIRHFLSRKQKYIIPGIPDIDLFLRSLQLQSKHIDHISSNTNKVKFALTNGSKSDVFSVLMATLVMINVILFILSTNDV